MASTYDNNMPTTYATGTGDVSGSQASMIDKGWMTSIPSIIKVVEIVDSLITFICATVWPYFAWNYGGGWVQFVSMFGFLMTIVLYIMYLFYIVEKIDRQILPPTVPFSLIELIYNGIMALFYFIAGIVSAVAGSKDPSIGAAAFFCFMGMLIFGVDAFIKFQQWRGQAVPGMGTGSTAAPPAGTGVVRSTTTTTVTTTDGPGAGPPVVLQPQFEQGVY